MSKIKNKIKSVKHYFLKNKKASVLAYSLVIISVMVVIVASVSVVTVIEKKGAVSTDASVQAYQTADSGVQMAIKKINKAISENAGSAKIIDVFDNCGPLATSKGAIFDGAEYKLSFFSDEEGNTQIDCSATIDQIQSIKSVGEYKDTVRAVQVAVAASGKLSGCVLKSANVPLSGGVVSCDSGYIATGGGCQPSSGGDITASTPSGGSPPNLPTGWACSSAGGAPLTAYAICCKTN